MYSRSLRGRGDSPRSLVDLDRCNLVGIVGRRKYLVLGRLAARFWWGGLRHVRIRLNS